MLLARSLEIKMGVVSGRTSVVLHAHDWWHLGGTKTGLLLFTWFSCFTLCPMPFQPDFRLGINKVNLFSRIWRQNMLEYKYTPTHALALSFYPHINTFTCAMSSVWFHLHTSAVGAAQFTSSITHTGCWQKTNKSSAKPRRTQTETLRTWWITS